MKAALLSVLTFAFYLFTFAFFPGPEFALAQKRGCSGRYFKARGVSMGKSSQSLN
jgi:threonine/homoserine/homoserine lactone efflux protein